MYMHVCKQILDFVSLEMYLLFHTLLFKQPEILLALFI
jgi:hypothetical protein